MQMSYCGVHTETLKGWLWGEGKANRAHTVNPSFCLWHEMYLSLRAFGCSVKQATWKPAGVLWGWMLGSGILPLHGNRMNFTLWQPKVLLETYVCQRTPWAGEKRERGPRNDGIIEELLLQHSWKEMEVSCLKGMFILYNAFFTPKRTFASQ